MTFQEKRSIAESMESTGSSELEEIITIIHQLEPSHAKRNPDKTWDIDLARLSDHTLRLISGVLHRLRPTGQPSPSETGRRNTPNLGSLSPPKRSSSLGRLKRRRSSGVVGLSRGASQFSSRRLSSESLFSSSPRSFGSVSSIMHGGDNGGGGLRSARRGGDNGGDGLRGAEDDEHGVVGAGLALVAGAEAAKACKPAVPCDFRATEAGTSTGTR